MPTPTRTATLLATFLAVGFYLWIFLVQPLVENGEGFSRGLYIVSNIVYPDFQVSTWFGENRLPLAISDRLPLAMGTLAWLGLAGLIGWPWCGHWVSSHSVDRGSTAQSRDWSAWLVQTSLACLVGLGLLSTLTLVLGLAGGLGHRAPLLVGAFLLSLCSWLLGRRVLRWNVALPQEERRPQATRNAEQQSAQTQHGQEREHSQDTSPTIFERVLNNVVMAGTLWLAAATMLGAWVPPAEFDVVEYHLQAPKEFFQSGHIDFVPHNIYANMPLGAEMHALAMMTILQQPDAWLGGLIGKSITASISLLGAAMLAGWIARRLNSLSGWTAAGVWLSSPGIAQVATQGLIDGVLAAYVLATAMITWQALISDRHIFRNWAVAFLLAGATAALKYPGLIYATIPCLALAAVTCWRWMRQRHIRRTGPMILLAGLGLALTCLPWYAKNWLLAGNPVYPLAANIFGGQTLTPEKISQWQAAHRVPAATNSATSVTDQFAGTARQFGGDIWRLTVTSAYVQPAMILGLACAIAWLLRFNRISASSRPTATVVLTKAGWLWLAWSMWILAVWWLATHRIDRFWLPVTGLWSALAAWGFWQVRQRSWALGQFMLLPGILYGALFCSSHFLTDNRYFVSLAALRDDVGDAENPPRVPPFQVWINQHLSPQTNRVLLVGEARVFEYRVPVIYSTCFDTNPGESWLRGRTAVEQRQALQDAGVTHVVINWVEIQRYRSPGNYGFSLWPQVSDVAQLVRDQVLEPIDWGGDSERVTLLRVK